MELVNHRRPHRAIVRCKAKMQLLKMADDCLDWNEPGIDTLLEELAATLFQSDRYWLLYKQCHSTQEAQEAEDRLANELATATYRMISKLRQDPVVQSFNALL